IGNMVEAAEIAAAANPNLIDINYGCPVKAVACKGAGAALLQDIPKMVAMTAEIVKCTQLPVTVKTRLGWDDKTKNIVEVAERLQDIGIAALTVHGRTRVQMYKGDADWTLIGRIKENPRMTIPIFGNGDIDSPQKAVEYRNRYGVDGIMIGRAAIGFPWIFSQIKAFMADGSILPPPDLAERVATVRDHLDFSVRWKGDKLGIFEMRRHYAPYFKGLPDFRQYRSRLVEAPDYASVCAILEEVADIYSAVDNG
ncbi:MAG: tRNA dihydrouridine synthase, partial [Bacteroidota bacterium]